MDCVHTTTKICRFNRGAALRLSLYFGNSPEFLWMNLQTHYDLPGEILMQKTSGASSSTRSLRPVKVALRLRDGRNIIRK